MAIRQTSHAIMRSRRDGMMAPHDGALMTAICKTPHAIIRAPSCRALMMATSSFVYFLLVYLYACLLICLLASLLGQMFNYLFDHLRTCYLFACLLVYFLFVYLFSCLLILSR